MQAVEQRRQRDYERFMENRRFEEKTDIAERLGYPIDVTIEYELRGDAVYALSDTVERPFHSQTLQAKLAGSDKFHGDQAFEQVRLAHEHDEALMVDKLAAGKLDGTVLVKFSKVPDAVAENRTSIKGYRRDLLRSFVRMYYQTEQGVGCRLFTLDHNHSAGIERVGKLLDIDTARPSEVVLGDYQLVRSPNPLVFVDELVECVKAEYDAAVFETTGRRTHAGSVYSDRQDAMRIIEDQPGLINQHLDAIGSVMGELDKERLRKRTAAAIKLASEGHLISSVSDASVSVEVASGNYGGECATASPTGMNQAGQNKLMENVWSHGECQVCFARTMVGSCRVCAGCAAADDRGVDLLKLRERNLRHRNKIQRVASVATEQTFAKKALPSVHRQKHDIVRARYGERAAIKHEVVIGGAKQVIYDRRTKEILA